MEQLLVNHHLFQAGDTYGLIYAIVLSLAARVDDQEVFGLFWIDGDAYRPDEEPLDTYTKAVEGRLDYFRSYDLVPSRVRLVRCIFTDEVDLVELEPGPTDFVVYANRERFNGNPRLVSLFLTGKENDPSRWLNGVEEELDREVRVSEAAVELAASRLRLPSNPDTWGDEDEERLRAFLRVHFCYAEDKLRHLRTERGRRARDAFKLGVAGWLDFEPEGLRFGYISQSTDYARNCVGKLGFIETSRILRTATLTSTADYTFDNAQFIESFVKELHARKVPEASDVPPLIILFWIRAPRRSELEAVLKTFDPEADERPSVGKPQHHTNLGLYKQARHLVRLLAGELRRPLLFVPIGDELEEQLTGPLAVSRTAQIAPSALEHASLVLEIPLDAPLEEHSRIRLRKYLQAHYSYTEERTEALLEAWPGYKKAAKPHNLVRFWEREPLKGRPMGAQMNFLLQLAQKHRVLQVGMRSGSMERMMYLGVPTLYFDRTASVSGLPNPVGASRIKQLVGFNDTKLSDLLLYFDRVVQALDGGPAPGGYPLFFQIENTDTGFLKYSAHDDTAVDKRIRSLVEGIGSSTEAYNQFKDRLVGRGALDRRRPHEGRALLELGGLVETEAEKLCFMIWFVDYIYDAYEAAIADQGFEANPDLDNPYFEAYREAVETELQRIESLRQSRREKRRTRLEALSPMLGLAMAYLGLDLVDGASDHDLERVRRYLSVHSQLADDVLERLLEDIDKLVNR